MKWHFLFLLNLSILVNAQEKMMPYSIQDSIYKQLELFPQEKIHLHTDRTMYIPGEKIRFKAYLVDAFTHKSPTYSQYIYVELINQSDSLVHRVMVIPDENGLFHGQIFLSEKIPDGNYTLRAYTHFMESLGDSYFFKKNIRIWNIGSSRFSVFSSQQENGRNVVNSEKGKTVNASVIPAGNDYDVSFFPEGGYMVEGVINRVAFKSLSQNGASENITGEIVDDEDNLIFPDVKTVFAGMGSFPLGAAPGKTYFLVSKNSAGLEKRFLLPAVRKTSTVTALHRNNQYIIQLKKSPDMPQRPLYLFVHCKGEVLHYASWDYRKDYILLPANRLPSGVIQIILFDEFMHPISERLVFNQKDDETTVTFQTDKAVYDKREKVIATIRLPKTRQAEGRAHIPLERVGESYSIAVTDDADISIDSLNTITASLLLSSELPGYIESPGYYLQKNKESAYALDLLMMTHGWRRYDLAKAIKGDYSLPATDFEITKEISGTVRNYMTDRPVVDREVMLVSNDQSLRRTTTDSVGQFRFGLNFPDSTSFFLMAMNKGLIGNVKITLNTEKFPAIKHAPVSTQLFPVVTKEQQKQTDLSIGFIEKAGQRAQYDEDIKVVNLEVIEVTANRIEKRNQLRLSSNPINASAERTIYRDDMKRMPFSRYIADYLIGTSGVQVFYSDVTGEPVGVKLSAMTGFSLIYIDGVLSTIDDMNTIPIEIVESIDVIRGVGASILGVRGTNGAISVTTGYVSDNSNNLKSNAVTITPLGYQKPVEFYSPKYDTPESGNMGIPDYRTTIFWKPDVLLQDDGKATFEFYTSDFKTTYSVVIEGITNDGNIIRQVERIEVRP